MGYNVAIVGATGAVGLKMREILAEREFPVNNLRLLASERSAGKVLNFKQKPITVETLTKGSFENIDIALFSAGSGVSNGYAPIAATAGSVVIDNSSAFRMDEDVPLVVPEVNSHQIKNHNGIIANPNCSTIQLVVALKPIHTTYTIKRIVISTYQAVSGGGLRCAEELRDQTQALLRNENITTKHFPHQIAFNALPQIPQKRAFLSNGYTTEEMKLLNETRKILGDHNIEVSPTCVRIPVFVGHSEAVEVTCQREIRAAEVRDLLSNSPGVEVLDHPEKEMYPLAVDCDGKDAVFVGRIREDLSSKFRLNMWIVSDNLRKGAALNAIQIAEML